MFFNKKNLFFSWVTFLASGSAWTEGVYWQEFETLKKDPAYVLVFDRNLLPGAREVAKSIVNGQYAAYPSVLRWMTLKDGAMLVHAKSMPKLYDYVSALCHERNIKPMLILILPDEGNSDIVSNEGMIMLGHDVLRECTDEELEAVIAREIGRVEHRQVSAIRALDWVCIGLLFYLYQRNALTGMQALLAWYFICPGHLLGEKLEWEADNFACKELNKSKGLMRFFQRLQDKEDKANNHFAMVREMIENGQGNEIDSWVEMRAYEFERFYYKVATFYKWLYETPYGLRPSPAERIKNAQRIVDQQENGEPQEQYEKRGRVVGQAVPVK